MVTTRQSKRRKTEVVLERDLPTAQEKKAPADGISSADRFRTATVLCDWLMTACEDGKAQAAGAARHKGAPDPTSVVAAAEQVNARVTALETLGLLIAAGLGDSRHLDLIASELKDEDVRIRKAALSAFTMLPGHSSVPHLDALFKLLAGDTSDVTRDITLAVLERVPPSALETFIDMKLRGGDVWKKLGWVDWACGLWAMTVLSSRALSRQLVTIARAADHMRRCTTPPATQVHLESNVDAARYRLFEKLRARGKAPRGSDDWWSEGEVVALVRLLNEPHGAPKYQGVSSVLQHIDPSAVCLGVSALLDVALNAQEGSTYLKRGEVAVHALNVFAYPTLQSEKVPPPPPLIAPSMSGALTSRKARRRAAAAAAVGLLHRRLAEPHYARLWELLKDRDTFARENSGDALHNGAGAAEVRARLEEIHRKLRDRKTRYRELRELVWVLGALTKPWPSYLLPEILRLCMSDESTLAGQAVGSLNSFSGRDLSAAFTKRVAKVWRPGITVTVTNCLLDILKVAAFKPFVHEHADFVAKCLGHSAADVCDSALKLMWTMSADVRRQHLGVVASALMRQHHVKHSYVRMLGGNGSGLAVSDLTPITEALESKSKRLKALTVLRGLKKYHVTLLRTVMSPVARCLTDTDDLVCVMALRVMAGAKVTELASEDVRLVADQLLHADDRIRREATVVLNALSSATLGLVGSWLVEQLLHVPQHETAIVTCVQRLLKRLPEACMPAHVEALTSALESGCAATQATVIDTLMSLNSPLLVAAMPRIEALVSQAHVPAALKMASIRIACRVPAAAHTSALADAVVTGMSDEEHLKVREVCVQAIQTLQYSLLHERAGTVVSALLTMRPLRLMVRGACLLASRAVVRTDGSLVEAHLGMVLQAMHDADCTDVRDAASALAGCFADMCVRSHADALGRLLHNRDITIRRESFDLVHSGSAREAIVTIFRKVPSKFNLPRRTVLAALLESRWPWQAHHLSMLTRAFLVELQERLDEGDEATRLKILELLDASTGTELSEDLSKTIKRVVDEGSLSVRLAAASLMRRLPQRNSVAFEDGYMSVDFNIYDNSMDEDTDSAYDDDAGDY